MKNVAGVWFELFDTIEWMNVMSSTHVARLGSNSLIHAPLCPCCLKVNGLLKSRPGFPKNVSILPLFVSSWPSCLLSSGL